jgi:hypothetical protein
MWNTSDPKIPLAKMTISFWTYFGEALLDADFFSDTEGAQMSIAHQVYVELVGILQRKSRWPPPSVLESWSNGAVAVKVCRLLISYPIGICHAFRSNQRFYRVNYPLPFPTYPDEIPSRYRRDIGEAVLNA